MVGKPYKIGAEPILRPRKLRIGHEDEKMKYLLKRLSRREESFLSQPMAYSGLTVESGVFWKTFFSLGE